MIKSFENQSLWLSLDYDGDGSWILDGMLAQSLVIIHDGSYMKEVSTHISLVATMIYCRIAKAQCKCTWAKQLASAGSYCGKILGGVIINNNNNSKNYSGLTNLTYSNVGADAKSFGIAMHRCTAKLQVS